MNMKIENNKHEVDLILDILEQQKKRKTDEFFYTRLRSRMESISESKRKKSLLSNVYYPAALVMVMLVNVYVIQSVKRTHINTFERDDMLNMVAEDYHFSNSNSLIIE